MPSNTAPAAEQKVGQEFHVHPLVLVNLSDHYTRQLVDSSDKMVIGAVLGVQKGLEVSLYDSFEIQYGRNDNGKVVLDQEYIRLRLEQFVAIFPKVELMGWYTIGKHAEPIHMEIHQQLMGFNESPLFLLLNPQDETQDQNLPLILFESQVHLIQDKPTRLFVQAPYKIKTLQAERIAVDHVAKIVPAADGTSARKYIVSKLHQLTLEYVVNFHLENVKSSVSTLTQRMQTLHAFLKATHEGKVPVDHELLRRISSVCDQLPVADSDSFKRRFLTDYNDTLLMTYLASITKGSNGIADIIEKFGSAQDYRPKRRGSMLV